MCVAVSGAACMCGRGRHWPPDEALGASGALVLSRLGRGTRRGSPEPLRAVVPGAVLPTYGIPVLLILAASSVGWADSVGLSEDATVLHQIPTAFTDQLRANPRVYVAMALLLAKNADAFSRRDGQSLAHMIGAAMSGAPDGDGSDKAAGHRSVVERITQLSQPPFEGGAGLWSACMARYVICLMEAGPTAAIVASAMLRHVAIVLSVAYNGVGTTPPVPSEAALGGPTAVWLEYDRLKRTAFMMTGALEHLAHFCSATWGRAGVLVAARRAEHPQRLAANGRASGERPAEPRREPGSGGAARREPERSRRSSGSERRRICFAFNNEGRCSRGGACEWLHACRKCGGDHSEVNHPQQPAQGAALPSAPAQPAAPGRD